MTKEEMRYKIDDEIIVDCYDEYEVNMGWYYFFRDELEFPFKAEVVIKNRKGDQQLTKVDVLGISTEDGDFHEISEISFEVAPKDSELVMNVEASQLKNLKGSKAVKEALEIWNFWKSDNY